MQDAIYLNPRLFARVQTIYNSLDRLKLDPESRHLVVTYYRRFLHAGADLSPAKQSQLRQINQQLATLQAAFERKLLAGTTAAALVVKDKSRLAGLSDSAIAAAEQAAVAKSDPGGYLIPLQNTTQQPGLTLLQTARRGNSSSRTPGRARRRTTTTIPVRRSRRWPNYVRRKHKCSAIRTSPPISSRKKWRRRLPPYGHSCKGSSGRPA